MDELEVDMLNFKKRGAMSLGLEVLILIIIALVLLIVILFLIDKGIFGNIGILTNATKNATVPSY
ncbi:hypothetical protein M1316_01720 [Candidatus Parvarchaeota archaeon]|jgi:uncharacterized protein (UPF0333 family)|nr:hypothetical protein [Candidatus Parvarchaeota archaeon]